MVDMKRILHNIILSVAAVAVSVSCIQETVPVGGSVTQEQVSASKSALMSMINSIPATLYASGAAGYAGSYGDHTDFGMPGVHLRLEHMLEDIATMADNPYYNRFYAYDMNMAQGSDYTYCAYFWDCYYAWIKLANEIIIKAGEITSDTDKTIVNAVGQAYAYRAMFYLDLARLYEPKQNKYAPVSEDILGLTVPIVDENTTEEIAKNNPRATREDLYEFIFSDLAKAEQYLATAGTVYNQPTVGAVYGLYARAYLELGAADDKVNTAAYKKAAEYARKAITTSGKTPLTEAQWTDPATGFNKGSANNSWIWGLPVSNELIANIICYTAHISC